MSCLSVRIAGAIICGVGMAFLNSICFPLSWVTKADLLPVILVDICRSEKGAGDGQWEDS